MREESRSAKDLTGLPHKLREEIPKGPIFSIIFFDKVGTLGALPLSLAFVQSQIPPNQPCSPQWLLVAFSPRLMVGRTHLARFAKGPSNWVQGRALGRATQQNGDREHHRVWVQGGMAFPKELMSIPRATPRSLATVCSSSDDHGSRNARS